MTEPTATTTTRPGSPSPERVLVAGIGNLFFCDDGFGPEVVRRFAAGSDQPVGVRLVDYGIRGMHLAYDLLDGYEALVIVDTAPGPGGPGELRVLQIDAEDLGSGSFDAHGMDPVSVLSSLDSLGGTLPVTYLLACTPETTEEGIGLSAPVEASVPRAVDALHKLLTGTVLPGLAPQPRTERVTGTTPIPSPAASGRVRARFEVTGVVQGVGFRPFVYTTAARLGLAGAVRNDATGVIAEVEGGPTEVDAFADALNNNAPPLASIVTLTRTELPIRGGTGFTIEASSTETSAAATNPDDVASGAPKSGWRPRTLASPDVAMCADCESELRDPTNRRYRHPFITCTNCGPRFTIITGLPYDRDNTTMAGFAMCPPCRSEYQDPTDRRFHAQPIACPECGPQLSLWQPGDRADVQGGGVHDGDDSGGADAAPAATGERALQQARAMLADGAIIAVKGIGGFHLACDAGNHTAVATLRERKRRGDKPFALMAADSATAASVVELNEDQAALLGGGRRPILLLPRLDSGSTPTPSTSDTVDPASGSGPAVAPAVAPGSPELGVMLPNAPLHTLLFGLAGDDATPQLLVMTSGNLAGEPIVTDDAEALTRLSGLADAVLGHDRPIHVPCDDSVLRFTDEEPLPIRRSRGYAPLPIALPFPVEPTLATGADVKNTCAVAQGRYAWISQHIGDMDDAATLQALGTSSESLQALTGVTPTQLAADAHPGYRSSQWATEHADGRPVRRVQHHHAHIAAVMAEHGCSGDEPVIGIAFDGTGYGTDAAIWGGEVLLADYKGFRRMAHLAYVPLAGGDASITRPYRMALSHLATAGLQWDEDIPSVAACPPEERRVLAHQLQTGFGCVPTSSMGRLFDAVASLAGVRQVIDYEAEAAMQFEGLARDPLARATAAQAPGGVSFDPDTWVPGQERYHFRLSGSASGGEPVTADAASLIRAVVADVRDQVPAAVISAKFHAGVAGLIVELANLSRQATGIDVVALGGGVFCNAVLLGQARNQLWHNGFTVLIPSQLPPNDGGIALGQILISAAG